MKILSAEQLREADQYTIKHEPITSADLMERAGKNLAEKIVEIFPATNQFYILSGTGNNGGDGLVIARILKEKGKNISISIVGEGTPTPDFEVHFKKLQASGTEPSYIRTSEELNLFEPNPHAIIIDALFGTGLNRPIEGVTAQLIDKINQLQNFTLAIDIPSGLSADGKHTSTSSNTVIAHLTLTLQLPKLSFFFVENEVFTGKIIPVNIGLHPTFLQQTDAIYHTLEKEDINALLKPRPASGHKGSFGHVLIAAGSKGKTGAAILSATAALKTGCGLVTLHLPSGGMNAVHAHAPELMVEPDENESILTDMVKDITRYSAVGFGPGTGTYEDTAKVLRNIIQHASQPLIIDADGINILAANKTWLAFLTGNTILTPHPGEFDRLTQPHQSGQERFYSQVEFSKKNGVYVVLKGHHTSITTPGGLAFFNTTGNSGMATAGSGDVLTGIITSLCAQGYSAMHACMLGVYLHGYAGDQAATEVSEHSLVASDLIRHIGDFFKG